MKNWPIALQVYSVRDYAEKDFAATMREVKAMGYDGVELAGTYGMTAVECKKILDEIGLTLVSAHVNIDLLEDDGALADYVATGIRYVVIPWLVGPQDSAELEASIARIRNVAQRCKAAGLQLLYHNHDFEFVKIDGKYVLDTCWVNVGGENPAEYVRKYAGRAPIVHLKDFAGRKSENMYALIGSNAAKEDSEGVFEFRPVGYGLQDIPGILAAAEDALAQWVVVEQDRPSMDKTPMECAAMSIDYIKQLL